MLCQRSLGSQSFCFTSTTNGLFREIILLPVSAQLIAIYINISIWMIFYISANTTTIKITPQLFNDNTVIAVIAKKIIFFILV
jgi:hypothetical protein